MTPVFEAADTRTVLQEASVQGCSGFVAISREILVVVAISFAGENMTE